MLNYNDKFTCKACGSFRKIKKRKQKFKELVYVRYIYQQELVKSYFQHDRAYGDFRHLIKRTASEKVSRDKTFNIAKYPEND